MARIPVALQLYTLRNEMKHDFIGILGKVAKIGYSGVEFAGYGGLAAEELKTVLDDLGLKVAGSHVPLSSLENDLTSVIRYNQTIGNRYVVCPSIPPERRQSAADWRILADIFNRIGKALRDEELQLCYHNHAFEFEKYDGQYGFDILYEETDPELVKAEIDVYWVQKGGENPAERMRKLGNRCLLVHLKDMEAGPEGFFAEVGEGILDLDAVYRVSDDIGAAWYIVEQDQCRRSPLESVSISIKNLKALGIA